MTELLAGGTVVTSVDPVRVAERDLVVADDGCIAAPSPGDGSPQGVVRRDCSGCLVVPGNVCAHTHLYSALARGMPYGLEPPEDFLQILQRVWWRLDRALDEEAIRASALVGGMEALLSGTTTLFDHHASPDWIDGSLDVIDEALGSLGVRSVLCYETSDRDGPERAAAGIEENRRFLARVRDRRPPLARGLVGAHASFTLGEGTLAACAAAASEHAAGIHIHAAEDAVDERESLARTGMSVVERLEAAGALDERTLIAHGVHLDEGEAAAVGRAGATVAHNARSNMNNGVGRPGAFVLGGRVALGTDGIGADMFEESRAAFFRLREDDLGAVAPWALARLAESGRLAGRAFDEPLLGTLEPGAPADLVVLDYDPPAPLDEGSFPGHWIFALSSRSVRDVMVAGEWVVRDRRLARVDQRRIVADAHGAAERLWGRLAELPPHSYEPKGAPA
jgi:putative selenium metabolism protein SsnA